MIDHGERVAYTVGIGPALSRDLKNPSQEKIEKGKNLEKTIISMVGQVMNGKIDLDWPEVPSIDSLSSSPKGDHTEDQIMSMIQYLPEEAKNSWKNVASNQSDFIVSSIPRSSLSGLLGPLKLKPSDVEVMVFDDLYRVASDPTYVIRLIGHGALLAIQVQAQRRLFPSISEFIDVTIKASIEEKKASNGEIPWKTDIGIRDWFGVPMIIAPYQEVYAEQAQIKANPPKPSSTGVSPESKASLSAAQSAMYRQVK